jgi:hypothetical protein
MGAGLRWGGGDLIGGSQRGPSSLERWKPQFNTGKFETEERGGARGRFRSGERGVAAARLAMTGCRRLKVPSALIVVMGRLHGQITMRARLF